MGKKNTLDDYRLNRDALGFFNWQDKRDDSGIVYKRTFCSWFELRNFLVEYFGERAAKKIEKEKKEIIGFHYYEK